MPQVFEQSLFLLGLPKTLKLFLRHAFHKHTLSHAFPSISIKSKIPRLFCAKTKGFGEIQFSKPQEALLYPHRLIILSPEQERVNLHGLDGDGESLLHLHALVKQGQRHLLHCRSVQLREQLLHGYFPAVCRAGHAHGLVAAVEALTVHDQGGVVARLLREKENSNILKQKCLIFKPTKLSTCLNAFVCIVLRDTM